MVRGNNAALNSEASGEGAGHPIVNWPGWVTNDARYSSQPDIMPLPIAPVHFVSWPFRQIQLLNGWELTNFGKRQSYDYYLNQLQSSASNPMSNPKPSSLKGNRQQPTAYAPPSQLQIQNGVFTPVGNQPQSGGGTGVLAPGVSLEGRRFYG
jgi:hypothetical protein